jgi:hypothetical protein
MLSPDLKWIGFIVASSIEEVSNGKNDKDRNESAALIDINWPDTKHDACVYCCDSQTFDSFIIKHQPQIQDAE